MFDHSVLPGGESRGLVTITNSQNMAQVIRVEIADLTYTPGGLPQFTLPGNAPGSPVSWIAEEKTLSTVAVEPFSRIPRGGRAAVMVQLKGDGGTFLSSRTVTIRLFSDTTAASR